MAAHFSSEDKRPMDLEIEKCISKLGVVVHMCNLSTQRAEVGGL
jgi:hypothetical protein